MAYSTLRGVQLVAVFTAVGFEFTGQILGGALVVEVLVRPRSGESQLVGGEHIHGDLLGLAHREQRLAELGVAGQGLGRFIEQLRAGLLPLVFCGDLHGWHRKQFAGPLLFLVGIQAIEHMTHQIPQGRSAGHLGQLSFLVGGEASLHPIQAAGQGQEHVFVAVAHPHQLQQLCKRHRGVAIQRRIGLHRLHHPHAIDHHKLALAAAIGADCLEVGVWYYPHSPALHLLKQGLGAHHPQKNHTLQWLDVRAGGDHVHRYRHPRVVGVGEIFDQLLWPA